VGRAGQLSINFGIWASSLAFRLSLESDRAQTHPGANHIAQHVPIFVPRLAEGAKQLLGRIGMHVQLRIGGKGVKSRPVPRPVPRPGSAHPREAVPTAPQERVAGTAGVAGPDPVRWPGCHCPPARSLSPLRTRPGQGRRPRSPPPRPPGHRAHDRRYVTNPGL